MPKQVLEINNFAGGLNAYSDARDISDNQFVQNWNAVVSKAGIIKVSGMCKNHISTEYFQQFPTNFQAGVGLFQFTSDYSFTELDTNFKSGIAQGTINTVTSASVIILEDSAVAASTDSVYVDMIIYIYEGEGVGQSRKVSAYVGSSRTLTVSADFSTALHDKDDSNPSKYIIYRWTPSSALSGDGSNNKDWLSDVYGDGEEYCITTKSGTVASTESKNLGYIEYKGDLSLFSGIEYSVEFRTDSKEALSLPVSDGKKDGNATNNFGDKPAFVELYSTTVADTQGSIKALSDTTPTPSGAWEASKKYFTIQPDSTSKKGTQSFFDIHTDASGNPTFFLTEFRGINFVANDTLTFTDPGSTSNTATITVASINITGLSLIASDTLSYKWLSGIGKNGTESGYKYNAESNYIENGDFRTNYNTLSTTGVVSNESTVSATDSTVTLTVDTTAATESLLLEQSLYKSDGTFIGICTAVNSTTEIVFGKGIDVDIANDTTLYVQIWDIVRNQEMATSDFSNHGISVAQASGDASYDLASSGAIITTSDITMNEESGFPHKGGLSQTITLHEHTCYNLNFVYAFLSFMAHVEVRVIDPTRNDKILLSKNLYNTANLDEGIDSGFESGSEFANVGLNQPAGGLFFTTGRSRTKTDTMPIKIQFMPVVAVLPDLFKFFLHGVTVYKNHFDTSNISIKEVLNTEHNAGVNAYTPYIHTSETTHKFNFTIPSNYTNVTDWVFRIYAGKYGHVSGYNTDSQEIKIKDFKITSNRQVNKDVITMLVDNKNNNSSIHLHNTATNLWTLDYIKWSNTNAFPVYNYINGMLKISDGNFNNNNSNKLIYYSNSSHNTLNSTEGWVKTDEALVSAPSVSVFQINEDPDSSVVFDACKYFNDIFTGKTFRQNESIKQTNWPLDSFGPITFDSINSKNVLNAVGMPIRTFTAKEVVIENGKNNNLYTQIDTTNEITTYYQQLFNQNSQWYIDNVLQNLDVNELNSIYNSSDRQVGPGENESTFVSDLDRIVLTNLGINTEDDIHPVDALGIGASPQISLSVNDNEPCRNPLSLIIEPQAFQNLTDEVGNPIGNLKEIDLDFTYETIGFQNSSIDKNNAAAPPIFNFDAGVPNDSAIDSSQNTILNKMIEGEELNFALNKTSINKIIGDVCQDPSQYSNSSKSIWDVCFDGNLDRYDSKGKLKSASLNRSRLWTQDGWHYIHPREQIQVSMNMQDKIIFSNLQGDSINPKTDHILIKLREVISHAGVTGTSDGHQPFFFIFGGLLHSNESVSYDDHNSYQEGDFAPKLSKNPTLFSRFIINKLDLKFYNENQTISNLTLDGTSIAVNFSFGATQLEGLGWANKIFKMATTTVNRFDEESAFSSEITGIGEDTNNPNVSYVEIGHSPHIRIKMLDSYLNNPFINKTKFYMKDTESDIWYVQFFIDHKTKTLHSTTSSITADVAMSTNNESEFFLDRSALTNFNEVNSYESETMVSQDDAVSNNLLTARYKCSVVANNRLYVGNIMQDDKIMADRMLKSPIGKYNILPKSSFIDVAINDGDEITALAYYKDKLLQYKQRKVFIINISGDFEFLEDTFENVGVKQQCCVTETPYGIVWVNKSGCYLYDGSQLTNLIENKISPYQTTGYVGNYWRVEDNVPVIGYSQKDDIILIKFTSDTQSSLATPDSATYHFPTQSWMFALKSFNDMSLSTTGQISNIITDKEGDLLVYRNAIHVTDNPVFDGIKKYNYEPYAQENNLQITTATGTKVFTFTTKDFTFGNLSARKKIYKVYITYRTTSGNNSNIVVNTSINGGSITTSTPFSASKSKFFGTSTACYHASNGLLDTGGGWKTAELRFTSSSSYNNVNSFQLSFVGGTPDPGFEINDISIVYKTKRVK